MGAITQLLIDFKEGSAGVLRVHLHVAEIVGLKLMRDAHAQ